MGWLSGYSYRKKCTVVATAAGAQTNYQMKLLVGESSGTAGEDVDCESHCQDFPNDLRFTAADGLTKHDYWVESLTGMTPNRLATVWIEIASVPVTGSVDFYIYYGKSGDSGESVGDNTFEFFDDFEGLSVKQNYFVDDVARYGASADVSGPQATYYNNKTYIALHGQNLDPYAIVYNHTTGKWSDKVYVGNNPLGDNGHGTPAILRDSSGYLHIFYGSHNNAIQYAKSTNADDITMWTDKGNIESGTYPHPILADNGDIYVFYRNNNSSRGVSFQKSTDGGDTWSAESIIIDFGDWDASAWIYISKITHESGAPEKVHMAWIRYDYPNVETHNNVYYAYFNISDGHMYDANGTDLGTTVTGAEGTSNCLVYDSSGVKCHYTNVHIDSSGIPYIIFNNNATFKFTKWNGSAWTLPQTITTTDTWQKSYDFVVHSSTNIEAYFDTGNKIEKWIYNGTIWSLDSIIADGADYDNSVCLPAVVHNYTSNLKMTFSQCLAGNSNKAFAHGDSGFIGDTLSESSAKWATVHGSPDYTNTEQKWSGSHSMKLLHVANATAASFPLLPSNDIAIRYRLYKPSANRCEAIDHGDSSKAAYVKIEGVRIWYMDDISWHNTGYDINGAAWNLFEMRGFDWMSHTFDMVLDDVEIVSGCGMFSSSGFENIAQVSSGGTEGSDVWLDDVLVRKYVSPEPTWGSWDSEEKLGLLRLKLLQAKGLNLDLSQKS